MTGNKPQAPESDSVLPPLKKAKTHDREAAFGKEAGRPRLSDLGREAVVSSPIVAHGPQYCIPRL